MPFAFQKLNEASSNSNTDTPDSTVATDATRTTKNTISTSYDSSKSPIVLFGPSGAGKSSLLKRLQQDPEWSNFGFSVSHTTRQPRPNEENGVAYHFVDRVEFLQLVAKGAFIEHAEFGSNLYGTTAAAVSDVSEIQKKRCILDIDAQGVRLILANHPHLQPLIIFISPPSLQELSDRLMGRGTETAESLATRLAMAKGEIEYAASGVPNMIIVNDDLDRAYRLFKAACVSGDLKGDTLPLSVLQDDIDAVAKASINNAE